jgi:hypothetical protein
MNTRLRGWLDRRAPTWAPPLERFFARRGIIVENVTADSSTIILRGGWGGSKAVGSLIRWTLIDSLFWIALVVAILLIVRR